MGEVTEVGRQIIDESVGTVSRGMREDKVRFHKCRVRKRAEDFSLKTSAVASSTASNYAI